MEDACGGSHDEDAPAISLAGLRAATLQNSDGLVGKDLRPRGVLAAQCLVEHDLFVGGPRDLADDQVCDGRAISFVFPAPIPQYPSRVLTHQIRIRIRQTGTEPAGAAVSLPLGDPHRVAGLPLARIGLDQEAHGPEREKAEGIRDTRLSAVKSPLLRGVDGECGRGERVLRLPQYPASNCSCPIRRPTRHGTGDSYWI